MSRLLIAMLFIQSVIFLFARAAHAEPRLLRVPVLPSLVAPLSRSVLASAGSRAAPAAAATSSMPATSTPVDHGFLSSVAKFLDGVQPRVSTHPRDAAGRNPAPRDPARERDATSFGIRTAGMSGSGAALAGAGIGASAAQLVDLANVANKVPVKFAPTMFQGGGGLALTADW
jgi:hypothetical protein